MEYESSSRCELEGESKSDGEWGYELAREYEPVNGYEPNRKHDPASVYESVNENHRSQIHVQQ